MSGIGPETSSSTHVGLTTPSPDGRFLPLIERLSRSEHPRAAVGGSHIPERIRSLQSKAAKTTGCPLPCRAG